jgi:hypothetical protein
MSALTGHSLILVQLYIYIYCVKLSLNLQCQYLCLILPVLIKKITHLYNVPNRLRRDLR